MNLSSSTFTTYLVSTSTVSHDLDDSDLPVSWNQDWIIENLTVVKHYESWREVVASDTSNTTRVIANLIDHLRIIQKKRHHSHGATFISLWLIYLRTTAFRIFDHNYMISIYYFYSSTLLFTVLVYIASYCRLWLKQLNKTKVVVMKLFIIMGT